MTQSMSRDLESTVDYQPIEHDETASSDGSREIFWHTLIGDRKVAHQPSTQHRLRETWRVAVFLLVYTAIVIIGTKGVIDYMQALDSRVTRCK
jgi:hypothetical protein